MPNASTVTIQRRGWPRPGGIGLHVGKGEKGTGGGWLDQSLELILGGFWVAKERCFGQMQGGKGDQWSVLID